MVSLDGQIAKTSFRASIGPQTEVATAGAAEKVLSEASLYYDFKQHRAAVADNVEVPHSPSVLSDERYVFPNFRALSQVHLVNRGLDFSVPGVLEAAVPMMIGKTVYLNHDYTDVNNWVGVVSKSNWDAKGDKSNGVPGIAVECKVDAYLNYRIACGVMMTPPAINAMSLTVLFEFEYSHPELEKDHKFWGLIGEEVDGHIVRLVVTKILEIWEASFVYVGEDRLAKNHGAEESSESFSGAEGAAGEVADDPLPNSNEEKTMKLTAEQKTKLGIEFDGEEVPETEIFKAGEALAVKLGELTESTQTEQLAELKAQAAAGALLVEEKRTEVTRLAKIAELGADDKELPPVIADDIKAASVERLTQLGVHYGQKVAEKFPKGGRSSLEDHERIDNAAGDKSDDVELPSAGLL